MLRSFGRYIYLSLLSWFIVCFSLYIRSRIEAVVSLSFRWLEVLRCMCNPVESAAFQLSGPFPGNLNILL
jgi:hypothetical protein